MRIAVLGVGLIGGSIGLAARGRLPDAEVTGFDPDPAALDAARELGAIDRAATSLEEAVRDAQACFACAPVGALPALVERALAAASADCVVSDVGSTKRVIVERVRDERFVGGHPVAGAETSGVANAREDLFDGAPWYLTPEERASGMLYERLHRLVAGLGARPLAVAPEAHDRLLAIVSHLPHVLANVLVSQLALRSRQRDERLGPVGPSFRDISRVAGANPGIWNDIYASNAQAIAEEIDEMGRGLAEVAARLRAGDAEAIDAWNARARGDRRRLLEADLAGGPVRELRVAVPNRPGVVAEVALAMGREGINITDLALAPAPDMRTGQITLWVTGEDAAARAEALIEGLGFPVAAVS